MPRQDRRSHQREARRNRIGRHLTGPVKPLVNKLPLVEVLSQEDVETIHRASMRLLKEVGMLIIDYPSGHETFRKYGAKVEGVHSWRISI